MFVYTGVEIIIFKKNKFETLCDNASCHHLTIFSCFILHYTDASHNE